MPLSLLASLHFMGHAPNMRWPKVLILHPTSIEFDSIAFFCSLSRLVKCADVLDPYLTLVLQLAATVFAMEDQHILYVCITNLASKLRVCPCSGIAGWIAAFAMPPLVTNMCIQIALIGEGALNNLKPTS